MTSPAAEPKRRMHRTITGSRVDLNELENVIQSASVRDVDLETSSVSSTRSGGGRSNIIQIVPGKKNVKAAMRAALAEASGYGDADDLGMDSLNIGSDDDDLSIPDDTSDTSTPKYSTRSSLKHAQAASHPSEPLEGAGVVRRAYQESSAPPEGAGGYQTGEFVPPQVVEPTALKVPKREPLGPGMHRSVTGSSVRLADLNDLVEKAGDADPGTPGSRSGRTPRSQSGMSMGSRSSSVIQIVPGVKDVRTTLANAIAEAQEGGSSQAPESDAPAGMSERQSIGGSTTPGSLQSSQPPFGTYRPRSIRRLMSEKSMTMDTVYSGALPDDIPSDPLEGTGVVLGRKYVEPKHGPQFVQTSPRDFPRVVNGVPMMGSGEAEEEKRPSVPPSPLRKAGGVHRTISGSQMNLHDLEAILEKATIPKSERQSLDGRSSTGVSQTTHRSVVGSGGAGSGGRNSQVFGEEQRDEPSTTFGVKAKSFNSNDLQDLIRRASVSRTEPDSPRSVASSVHA